MFGVWIPSLTLSASFEPLVVCIAWLPSLLCLPITPSSLGDPSSFKRPSLLQWRGGSSLDRGDDLWSWHVW